MKLSILKKITCNRNKIIVAGILTVALVHSAGQLFFIHDENLRSAAATAQIESVKSEELAVEINQPDSQIIDIKPEKYETPVAGTETAGPDLRRKIEGVSPQIKKKAVRETKEARLRRAERILTGV
jgi:hypothetical protein